MERKEQKTMDKETLSNYGWIVICVLVLSVMLALSTPFGKFIKGAIRNTTQGLFQANRTAMAVAGMNMENLEFCDHSETKTVPAEPATAEHPAHDAYTVCAECGKVMTADGKVPYTGIEDFTITKDNRAKVGYKGTGNEELVIPETFYDGGKWYRVTKIANYAFDSCSLLESITIPETVTLVGTSAFSDINTLKSAKFLGNIDVLGTYAFLRCKSLENVEIQGVKIIKSGAFAGCNSLSNLAIPNTVTHIEEHPFKDTQISQLIYKGTMKEWQNIKKASGVSHWFKDSNITEIKCEDGVLVKQWKGDSSIRSNTAEAYDWVEK